MATENSASGLQNIVQSVVSSLKGSMDQNTALLTAWETAVDAQEIKHSSAVSLNKGLLIVNVDSSPWLYHFHLKKDRLLMQMKRHNPEIQNIRFQIGRGHDRS